ncbi:anoctamin-7-like [Heterodontus francisci]|uniref:anoctamin-7-like n=1 Tax=Heterodontus francisci TaxID=7792 RepID=UPI00355B85B9
MERGTAEKLQVVDFVLVYEKRNDHPYAEEIVDFLKEVKKAGLSLDPDVTDQEGAVRLGNKEMANDESKRKEQGNENQIIKIHAPFEILSQAAEKMRLKMPMNVQITDTSRTGLSNVLKYLETDNEENYFSTPYRHDRQDLFKGIDEKTTFFRPAVRSLIVHHILNDIQIPIENQKEKGEPNEDTEMCFLQSSNTEKDGANRFHNQQIRTKLCSPATSSHECWWIIKQPMGGGGPMNISILNDAIAQNQSLANWTKEMTGYSKGYGLSRIPAVVLKTCAPEVAVSLANLLQYSYNTGNDPTKCKLVQMWATCWSYANSKLAIEHDVGYEVIIHSAHMTQRMESPLTLEDKHAGDPCTLVYFHIRIDDVRWLPKHQPPALQWELRLWTPDANSWHVVVFWQTDCEKEDGKIKKIPTLPYLLMKKAFISAFTLHEGPKIKSAEETGAFPTQENGDLHNSWMDLDILWARTYRFQPLWKIRNYFGEKIAFYFAVMEILSLSLIIPALIGLAIFIFGLYHSVSCYNAYCDLNTFLNGFNCSIVCSTPNMISEVVDKTVDQIRGICDNVAGRKRSIEQILNMTCATEVHSDCIFQVPLDDVFNVIKSSFDNAATPLFGLFICLWGTIFLEWWKRKNAELVYEWDVENYETDELVRPEFYGTEPDPITGEPEAFYSVSKQRLKLALSLSVGIIMVGCVFISVLAVVIYKTWARFRVTTSNSFESFLLTTVVSSLLNALSISILGKAYQIIAVKMTDWENYRTQTDHNDALIMKLFAFEFANSYSSLFYIAFLRTNNEQFFTSIGLPGLEDNCGELNNCMTELSFQVLTLMITKPFPKFIKDVIAPWLKKLMSRYCCDNKEEFQNDCSTVNECILRDYSKPDLGDFTLEEYTEKVIQYGYQMLFAVSFPLGPFFFFLTILFDIRVDANRLLWMYKRPIAHMAQDIGHWFTILDLINNIAVVTNGCLIAFTAEFGREKLFHEKLVILIVFEHIVFVVKFLLSTLIPDVPQHIRLAIKREKYEAQKKMEAVYSSSL